MRRCRPFKLIDTMIVITVVAIGLALMRPLWKSVQMVGMQTGTIGMPWQYYGGVVRIGLTMALLMLVMAYVWIRLVPPSLPTSDLLRQPGMLFFVLLIGLSIPLWPLSAFVPLDAPTTTIFAVALGLSWWIACRRYRSRAEPGWIEGLGRTFGVGLIFAIAAS